MNTKTVSKPEPKWLKFVTEYLPLIIFGLAYWKSDLITATKVLIAVTVVTTLISFLVARKVAVMPLVTAGILGFFGGLTILFEDETFIKIKPTVVQLVFAGILGGGLFFKKILVKKVMGPSLIMPDHAWVTLTKRLVVFFLISAALNELVWRTQSTDFWVMFKLFGLTGFTFAFFASQIPLFNQYMEEPAKGEGDKK